MFSFVDYVRESALEHPILEHRNKDLTFWEGTITGGNDVFDALPTAHTRAARVASTALHNFHNSNALSPLTQIDKIELLSRELGIATITQRSRASLLGKDEVGGVATMGAKIAGGILRGSSLTAPWRRESALSPTSPQFRETLAQRADSSYIFTATDNALRNEEELDSFCVEECEAFEEIEEQSEEASENLIGNLDTERGQSDDEDFQGVLLNEFEDQTRPSSGRGNELFFRSRE